MTKIFFSLVHNLSDESNTASLGVEPGPAPLPRHLPHLAPLNLSDDEDNSKPGTMAAARETVSAPPASKPRRIPLTSTRRKSPLKGGSSNFETQFDANNLDRNLSEDASHILETSLGAEASLDLGLQEDELATPAKRQSPRKRKGGRGGSPASKRPRRVETAEQFGAGEELQLMFSPEKRTRQTVLSKEDRSGKERGGEKSNECQRSRSPTPAICKAVGLRRSSSGSRPEDIQRAEPSATNPDKRNAKKGENLKVTSKIIEKDDLLKNKIRGEENRIPKALPSQPILDIERLAAESSKILSVLAASGKVKPDSDSNAVNSIKEKGKTSSLSMSSFMVFQNKFPFGTFEEDYK